ncbi:S-layer homology domain-containing protein [Robertmurraya andreesenii]|uniref:L,D-peptidoglycan transpeptidase YkuD (ErfK/YbiS/YcfS/YnhG family) n=1 Tax=Anoxybacillus andreesenii TaxID=1325932 RepID=A0ABT9V034_9BACL|nr:S-layer homology domain-containing protein [Robertmurraya andreesenii]MDQ0154262.1 L,D-peptidoglycan transpeptidase YkuD (ErfK/YbiS/YcfS/YnhG family) [Robertmurraya andreesenii]
MRRMYLGVIAAVFFMTFPLISTAASISFKDVSTTHWAKEEITYLANKGLIKGYGNGIFAPNDLIIAEHGVLMVERATHTNISFLEDNPKKPLTRGEVASLLATAFDLPEEEVHAFTDVNSNNSYYQAISQLTSNQIAIGYEDGSFKPDKTVTRAEFSVFLARVLDTKFRKIVTLQQQAEQRIIVTATSKTTANVQLQQRNGTKWQNVNTSYKAVIGKNGIGKTKEGDGKTPTGTYLLGTAFGWGSAISNLSYPFKKATAHDYWVDDVTSSDYNQWVNYNGDPIKRWKSYEKMTHPLYKYGVIVRYNDDPIISGKGSAIFLHTKNSTTNYTLGCIALNESDLITILKWLNETKKPIIIIR